MATAAKMPMIATTIMSSISVKPRLFFFVKFIAPPGPIQSNRRAVVTRRQLRVFVGVTMLADSDEKCQETSLAVPFLATLTREAHS